MHLPCTDTASGSTANGMRQDLEHYRWDIPRGERRSGLPLSDTVEMCAILLALGVHAQYAASMAHADTLIDLSEYPALLTVQDVADLLQVAVPTVRGYLRQGDIVKIKVGHGVRISRSDLERYLLARAQPRRDAGAPS